MRSHEFESIEAGRAPAPVRQEADTASPDLAARAAVEGRTEALSPAAVLRLQRDAGNAGVAAVLESDQEDASPVTDVVGKGGGAPLEAPVRQRMEASFGTDFTDVRVHAGGPAAESARAVDAHAYTVGNEIVLGEGQTAASDRTLAHELAHVVQQRQGPVDGTPAPGGISISNPADRFERAAETTADAVLSSGRAPDAAAGGTAVSAQREAVPGEEQEPDGATAQALAIQREGPADEENPEEGKEEAPPAASPQIDEEDEILL